MMLARSIALVFTTLLVAGSAQAVVKAYDASAENGLPGDVRRFSPTTCPPVRFTANNLTGFHILDDGGLGTVTLLEYNGAQDTTTNLGDELTPVFGPGAFIFIEVELTRNIAAPATSNTSGVGSFGPSGTDPGEATEWGVVSGFTITGSNFCVASPVSICNANGFSHGQTTPNELPSTTYDLGTWTFDAEGDFESTWYITRTSNGGISNNQAMLRGAFHGSSLPALPLLGLGGLALGFAAIGARTLVGRK